MEQRLTNRIAIVTGAGRGIGKAVALRLAKGGANVVVADINPKTAKQTAEEIQMLNRLASAFQIDIANIADIQPMIDRVVAEFERIDILVNAAGVAQTGFFFGVDRGAMGPCYRHQPERYDFYYSGCRPTDDKTNAGRSQSGRTHRP